MFISTEAKAKAGKSQTITINSNLIAYYGSVPGDAERTEVTLAMNGDINTLTVDVPKDVLDAILSAEEYPQKTQP
jgi:hypothetical protein